MSRTTISSLPVELLGEIFAQCLPQPPFDLCLSNSAFHLARVCRLWRDVVLSTPNLWTTFCTKRTNDERVVTLTKNWLSLAQDMPLTIHVVDSLDDGLTRVRMAFYTEICRHSTRWRSLTLLAPYTVISWLPFTLSPSGKPLPLPLLEALVIGDSSDGQEPINEIATFAETPRLKKLDIILDVDEVFSPHRFVVPWSQLTVFVAELVIIPECLFVLREAPNLLEFRTRELTGTDQQQQPSAWVAVPPRKLRVVELDGYYTRDFLFLLDLLTLPDLTELHLGTSHQPTNSQASLVGWASFESFLSRSACTIRELHICGRWMPAEHLVAGLRLLPSVEHLEVLRFFRFSHLWPLLHPTAAQAVLPRLQTLLFRSADPPHDETYEELLGMLFARSRTGLKRFELTWTQLWVAFPDHRVCARFRELSRRGVTALLGSVEEELWFRSEG